MSETTDLPLNLLWLQSGGCGGCSLSLLGAESPDLLTTLQGADIQLLWHPSLSEQSGGNTRNRVIARLLEIARVVVAMEAWARALKAREPFCNHAGMPQEVQVCRLIEAARGSLGHWLRIEKGRILTYQIIAPTTWNFSPRDAQGIPGALEQALMNAPVREGKRDPVSVQHIVRSFDPCMVCTVH